MKKLLVLTLLLFTGGMVAEAQILKKLGQKVEKKVLERVDNKVDRHIDKELDKADQKTDQQIDGVLSGNSDKNKGNDKKSTAVVEEIPMDDPRRADGLVMVSNDCSEFIWFKSGAMMEFEAKDEGDKIIHKSKMIVSKIYSQDGATVADVATSDNLGNEFVMQFKCAGDKLYMDFAAAIEAAMKKAGQDSEANAEQIKKMKDNTEMNFSDGFMSFPKNMFPGQKLEDVVFTMKTGTEQLTMEVISELLDRKVEAKEKITTAAGTFDCLKITGKRVSTMKVMGMNKKMGDATVDCIWFSPGIGVVKQASYSEKGKIMSSSELTAYKL